MNKYFTSSVLLLILNACSFIPKYERPPIPAPQNWRIDADLSSTIANIDWWKDFNDPVLDDLIEQALENNQDIQMSIARVADFQARLDIARSNLYPQIVGNGVISRQKSSINSAALGIDVPGYTNNYFPSLNIAYELDLWGKFRSASKRAQEELYAQEEVRRTTVLMTVSSVASSYVLLRQYDQQLFISQATLTSRVEAAKIALARFEGGLTSEMEYKQAQSEVDLAAIEVIKFQKLIPEQENLLSILVGSVPSSIDRSIGMMEWPLPPSVPAGLPSELLEQRPDILSAENQLKAVNAQIGVDLASFYPSFALTGLYGTESLFLHNLLRGRSLTWQYLGSWFQPIFTGGALTGSLDQSLAQQNFAYYYYQQTVLNAFREVEDSLVAHKSAREMVAVQLERVNVLQDYLHLAQLQYDNGQSDYLNVLDAERSLLGARLDWAKAQSDVYLSLIDIYKSLGGGWVVAADGVVLESESR